MANNKPLITVIVPAWNAADTIARCAESLCTQTQAEFEAILVNDGSGDETGTLCDSLAALDDRFRVIHQENGGVSAARNAGLAAARGSYLCFVDADDTVAPDYLEALSGALIGSDADWAICGYNSGTPDAWTTLLPRAKGVVTPDEMRNDADSYGNNLVLYSPVNKMYRTKLIQSGTALRFDPAYRIGEDWKFNLAYLPRSKKVAFVQKALYFSYDHPGRATRRAQPLFEEQNRALCQQTVDFFGGMTGRPDVAQYVVKHWVYVLQHQLQTLPQTERRAARKRILDDPWYRKCLPILDASTDLSLLSRTLCFALRHKLLWGWMFSPVFAGLTVRLAAGV